MRSLGLRSTLGIEVRLGAEGFLLKNTVVVATTTEATATEAIATTAAAAKKPSLAAINHTR